MTGGAKRLGGAIARRLAADGHRIVLHYHRSAGEAHALAAELDAAVVCADLADMSAAPQLIEAARQAACAPVDALVNNASTFEFDRPPGMDGALFLHLQAVNAGMPAALACALANQQDIETGAVVNLLDQKLANLNPDFFSYTCAKAALAAATPMLAQALGPRISVNAVSPGLTLPSGDQSADEFAHVATQNLLGRPVGEEAVAAAVAFLVGARGVTEQNLFVDCGQRFLRRDSDVMFDRERARA